MDDPEIQIVLNLTTPKAHTEVSLAALEAGKSVYVEKPLAVTRKDGQKMLDLAKANGLLVGGAPDTFLGGGLQTLLSDRPCRFDGSGAQGDRFRPNDLYRASYYQ